MSITTSYATQGPTRGYLRGKLVTYKGQQARVTWHLRTRQGWSVALAFDGDCGCGAACSHNMVLNRRVVLETEVTVVAEE